MTGEEHYKQSEIMLIAARIDDLPYEKAIIAANVAQTHALLAQIATARELGVIQQAGIDAFVAAGSPSDFDRANMADESARLDEANALEDARPAHHDHVSLAVVLRILDGVRTASITATEQEAVRRCHNAVMTLPTYVGCWP